MTRGEGILNNELYIGRRIFNRRTWVEVPNERRGFSRPPRLNLEAEWIVRNDPQLRIINRQPWEQVKALQAEARSARDAKFKLTGNPLALAKRPAHMLSGVVTCGTCGAPFLATGPGGGDARVTEREDTTTARSAPPSWKPAHLQASANGC